MTARAARFIFRTIVSRGKVNLGKILFAYFVRPLRTTKPGRYFVIRFRTQVTFFRDVNLAIGYIIWVNIRIRIRTFVGFAKQSSL